MKLIILFSLMVLVAQSAFALELKNIEAGQNGGNLYIKYDIINMPGELYADVLLEIEIDGNVYNSNKLAMRGDVGSSIPVGKNKRIVWSILKDMPAGYEGEITWYLDTKNNTKNDDPFNIYPKKVAPIKLTDKTVLDKTSNIMWVRSTEFGSPASLAQAEGIVEKMNIEKYAGYSDWKIPSKLEWDKLIQVLSSKYNYAVGTCMLDEMKRVGFNGVTQGYYWANDILEREYIDVDYNVNRIKSKANIVVGSNSNQSGSYAGSYNTNSYARNRTGSAGSSYYSNANASATAERYTAKTRTEMTNKDNAVINISNGYIYKKQLSANKAILMPYRIETSKRVIKSVAQIVPKNN